MKKKRDVSHSCDDRISDRGRRAELVVKSYFAVIPIATSESLCGRNINMKQNQFTIKKRHTISGEQL